MLKRILPVVVVLAACAGVAWIWLRPNPAVPGAVPASGTGGGAEEPAQRDGREGLPVLTIAVLPTCEDRLLPEPCNHVTGGGLDAAGPFIADTREHTGTIGVFLGDASLAPGPLGQAQIRLVHGYVLPYTNVQIVCAGEGELAHGVPFVRQAVSEMARAGGIALLGGNVTDAEGNALLKGYDLARYVAEAPAPQVPRTVLFVGVVGDSVRQRLEARGSDVVISPALAAARSAYTAGMARARELGQEVHDSVLLLQGSPGEAEALLAEGPEFTLAVAARDGLMPEIEPRMVGETPIFYPGRGMRFGLRILLNDAAPEPVRGFVVRFGEKLAKLAPPYREVLMEHLSKLGEADLKQAVAQASRPAHPAGDYVGAESCRECHRETFDQQAASAHAHRVVREGAVSPACVSCHATGTYYATGWAGLEVGSDLSAVSCEACHGPASAHLKEPEAPYGGFPLDRCLDCHLPDRSPVFDAEELWKTHGHAAPRTRR